MAEYIDKNRLVLCMNDWMLQNAPVKAGDDTTRADTILDAIKMVEDSLRDDEAHKNKVVPGLRSRNYPVGGSSGLGCVRCRRWVCVTLAKRNGAENAKEISRGKRLLVASYTKSRPPTQMTGRWLQIQTD